MRPPPGYPFEGDIPSRAPPPLSRGNVVPVAFILAFAGAMMGAGFMLVALVATGARHAAAPITEAQQMPLSAVDDGELAGGDPPSKVVDAPATPPPIERKIPVFPARFLEGCSSRDLDTIEHTLSAAITQGSPLYNDGDVVECADLYEAASRHLEGVLPASCKGPIHALADGRSAASKVVVPGARAWAMRDAFDGLIEIMDRSRIGGVPSL